MGLNIDTIWLILYGYTFAFLVSVFVQLFFFFYNRPVYTMSAPWVPIQSLPNADQFEIIFARSHTCSEILHFYIQFIYFKVVANIHSFKNNSI